MDNKEDKEQPEKFPFINNPEFDPLDEAQTYQNLLQSVKKEAKK